MENYRIAFKNSSEKVRNDIVYDGLFELSNKAYSFTIFPKSKFWRFGIRFSKTPEVVFDLKEDDRHQNKEFIDLHLSVGSRLSSGDWVNSNRLELVQYHFDGIEHSLNSCEEYADRTTVNLKIKYDSEAKILAVSSSSIGCMKYETELKLNDYPYFKIFAWADGIGFELECLSEYQFTDYSELDEDKGVSSKQSAYINGLVADDDTDWFEKAIKILKRNKYLILWWDKLPAGSNSIENTLNELRHTLNTQSYFDLYYVKNGQTNYKAVIKDFALSNNYNPGEWREKYAGLLLENNFEDYEGTKHGSGLQKAQIVFVAEFLEKIEPEFSVGKFKFLPGFGPPTQLNLHPYISVEKTEPIEESSPRTIFIEATRTYSITNNFKGAIGVKELAGEIFNLFHNLKDPTGNMIGIFGQWGRGKTFFWNRILDHIREEATKTKIEKKNILNRILEFLKSPKNRNKVIPKISFETVEFHAWKYQDTPASWAYLYENLSDKFISGNVFKKFRNRLKLNFIRYGFSSLIYFFIFLTINGIVLIFVPFDAKVNFVINLIALIGGVSIFIKIIYLFISYKPKAINLLNKYSEKVSFHKYLGIQAEIQKEVVHLMKAWIKDKHVFKSKILLFVDDIDRCDEEKIIRIIDSFKVMLEDEIIAKRIVVLMAIDERVLKMAIKNKYFDLVNRNFISPDDNHKIQLELDKLAKEYIDKLFISGIKLGNLSTSERKEIFDIITEGQVNINKTTEYSSAEKKEKIKEDTSNENKSSNRRNEGTVNIDENKVDPKIILGDDEFEIEEHEYQCLLDALNKNVNITPRALRIFYYRYLFAKRIMKLRFIKGTSLYDKWHNPNTDKSILPNLIIKFSSSEIHHEELSKEKESFSNQNKIIEKELAGNTYSLDSNLYFELLNVVEIVVPY